MKEGRSYLKVTLTERGSRRQESRHPWVYDNEVGNADEGIKDGDLVDVITAGGKYSGTGFYNSNSKIRVRIISRNANDTFDKAFWERRVGYALDYRQTVMKSAEDLKKAYPDLNWKEGMLLNNVSKDEMEAWVKGL